MSKAKLLIVDDEVELHDVLEEYLSDLEVEFVFAKDGNEAFDLIKSNEITTVVSDINMPNMDGLQLLAKLREEKIFTPLLFVTGVATKDNCVDALRLGAFEILEKPVDQGELVETVKLAMKAYENMQSSFAKLGKSDNSYDMARLNAQVDDEKSGVDGTITIVDQAIKSFEKCQKIIEMIGNRSMPTTKFTFICRTLQAVSKSMDHIENKEFQQSASSLLKSFTVMRVKSRYLENITKLELAAGMEAILKIFKSEDIGEKNTSLKIVLDLEKKIRDTLSKISPATAQALMDVA